MTNRYTVDEIKSEFSTLTNKTVNKLKCIPCLFLSEEETQPVKIGLIDEINLTTKNIIITYHLTHYLPNDARRNLVKIKEELDIALFEFTRIHWSLKGLDLHNILNINSIQASEVINNKISDDKPNVFLVHGQDHQTKNEVKFFIEAQGYNCIILDEQPNEGRTIIDKLQHYTDVDFVVVLYTPCDQAYSLGKKPKVYRARQNVIFEHGYFLGKLGRNRVTASLVISQG